MAGVLKLPASGYDTWLPQFQSLFPWAIYSRTDLKFSVHTPRQVCEWMGLMEKPGMCSPGVHTYGHKAPHGVIELELGRERHRPGARSLGITLPVPTSSIQELGVMK